MAASDNPPTWDGELAIAVLLVGGLLQLTWPVLLVLLIARAIWRRR